MAAGYMFSHYWPGDGFVNQPPVTATWTYPQWQGVIGCITLLLVLWA